jgi:hypothetical protein
MNIVAYCDQRYAQATRNACGSNATVLTCPPVYGEHLAQYATLFEQADLIYFNLHAAPNDAHWYISDGSLAANADQISTLNMSNAVVYMINCYAGGAVLETLKRSNPRAIIGGYGENLGSTEKLAGADLLGLWLRRGLAFGLTPRSALAAAKARLVLGAQTNSVKDALAFEVLYERSK